MNQQEEKAKRETNVSGIGCEKKDRSLYQTNYDEESPKKGRLEKGAVTEGRRSRDRPSLKVWKSWPPWSGTKKG